MKSWNIEIFLLDEAGNEKSANCFTKVVYNLHPSFANPVQSTSSICDRFTLANGLRLQPSTKLLSAAKTRDGESLT